MKERIGIFIVEQILKFILRKLETVRLENYVQESADELELRHDSEVNKTKAESIKNIIKNAQHIEAVKRAK